MWPTLLQPWPDVVSLIDRAERQGWHGVWLADHFMGDGGFFGPPEMPCLEATAALVAAAERTSRVRLGTLVLSASYRHPAVLANWAATVDQISHGRLTLGIGAGWQANEHEQYGIALRPPKQRVDAFHEYITVLDGMLRCPPASFTGEYFAVTEALCSPAPVQSRLPLLMGTKGPRMLRIAASFADMWNMWGTVDEVAAVSAQLDSICVQHGRNPSSIMRSTQALIHFADSADELSRFTSSVFPRPVVGGTTQQVIDHLVRYRDIGVDEFIVPDIRMGSIAERDETYDRLAREVISEIGEIRPSG